MARSVHYPTGPSYQRGNLRGGGVIYTEPFRQEVSNFGAFINPTHGVDLNVNGAYSGTPHVIHNGGDTSAWTASNTGSGTWDFASTTQAQSGTSSIDGTGTVNGASALFEHTTTISSDDYVGSSLWIYLTNVPSTAPVITVQYRLNGVNVGDAVDIISYINNNMVNTWQKVGLRWEKFNFGGTVTFDEAVISCTYGPGSANRQDFYIDNFQIEEAGEPITFTLAPPPGFILRYNRFVVTAVYPGAFTGTTPQVTWNKFFHVNQLDIGIETRIVQNGELTAQAFTRNFAEIAIQPGIQHTQWGGDGSNIIWTNSVELDDIVLNGDSGDYESFTVHDDLSTFTLIRPLVIARLEKLEQGVNK